MSLTVLTGKANYEEDKGAFKIFMEIIVLMTS